MTDWKIAMLLLLPVFIAQGVSGRWPMHKIRVWLAMFGASLAAVFLAPKCGVPLAAYIVIDTIAGAVVLARPAGIAQKAIGFFFACMVIFHMGFALSGRGVDAYTGFQVVAGWAQFGILALWGIDDAGKRVFGRFGYHWPFDLGPQIESASGR